LPIRTQIYVDDAASILIDIIKNKNRPGKVMEILGNTILSEEVGYYFYILDYKRVISAFPLKTIVDWTRKHGVEAARKLARHLPEPYINADNEPTVPPLTEFILREFEKDERTFSEFCAGVYSWKLYKGDIANQYLQEAETAKKFKNYPLKRIREWADRQVNSSDWSAESYRKRDEEREID